MNKALQAYLAIVATLILLFLAAILTLLVIAGVKLSQEVRALDAKADGLKSQIDSFNQGVSDLNSSLKVYNPFN